MTKQSQEAEGEQRWKAFPATMRNPTTADANAKSNNSKSAIDLENNRSSMQARIYNLLSMQNEYLNMSTKLIPGDSMESIHGTIHDTVGGDGPMTWLFYSAFDPIFWLHHWQVFMDGKTTPLLTVIIAMLIDYWPYGKL